MIEQCTDCCMRRLMKAMRKERVLVQALVNVGLSPSAAIELLTHHAISAQKAGAEEADDVFDVRDDSENEEVVIWWNDLERDERYAEWPDNIFDVS